ncbi:MAG: glycerol-3-phosphate acyltransferase [Actinomycetota bacterium]|nr:glycerol-3-phosphate acyltransferase [Actinomycetota bacterium]
MRTFAWAAGAFIVGTLPSPYVIAKVARRNDVIAEMRRPDSAGDAHFLLGKQVSKAAGVVAIIADMLKGFFPALAARITDQPASTLAWVGVAAVAGHSFAPFLRAIGGRGLTTAAGVSLVIVPKAMIATGVIALVGTIARAGGLATGVGFALLAVFAAVFGYAAPLVWMAAGVFALIAIRRLEGVGDDRRGGVPVAKAVVGRVLWDLPNGRHS